MYAMAGVWVRDRIELTVYEGQLYLTAWWEIHRVAGGRHEQKVMAVGFFRPTRTRVSALHLSCLGSPARIDPWNAMGVRIEEPLR